MSNLISYNWDGLLSESAVPIYSRFDFIMAISIVPICCLVGIIGFYCLSKKSKTHRIYRFLKDFNFDYMKVGYGSIP